MKKFIKKLFSLKKLEDAMIRMAYVNQNLLEHECLSLTNYVRGIVKEDVVNKETEVKKAS